MDAARLEELRAEAAHARQRVDLYRQRAYGPRPTSETRMRELQRTADSAADRLRHAEAQARAAGDAAPPA